MPEYLHPGVYVQEVPPAVRPIQGGSTSTAAFIGVADKGTLPQVTGGRVVPPALVTSFADYSRNFGGFRRDSFLTYAVRSFFDNGGSQAYIVRVAPTDVATAQLPVASPPAANALPIRARSAGAWGNGLYVSVAASSDGIAGNFKLLVQTGQTPADAARNVVESYDNVTFLPASGAVPANYVKALVNGRSQYIAFTSELAGAPAATAAPVALTGGSDGNVAGLTSLSMAGAQNLGTGLYALDKVTDVSLIAIPGWGDPQTVNAGMDYCKNSRPLQDCFFIGDIGSFPSVDAARQDGAVPSVVSVSDARAYATTGLDGTALDKSAGDYGAIYYPWILAADPLGAGANPRILLPPSGFLAGIYARIDSSRGVFKAPAGTEAGVAGALAPAVPVSDTDQDILNPNMVNALRTVPGSGVVVWGTRTLSSDPGWRYIPVRRIAIFLRTSIYNGIQWAVFEPNDEPLWASLRLNIRAFMLTQFRAGAFQGATPDAAFFVQCDATTTTQTDIDNGVVNIRVGFAPLKPAEFVVLELSQKVSQPAS